MAAAGDFAIVRLVDAAEAHRDGLAFAATDGRPT